MIAATASLLTPVHAAWPRRNTAERLVYIGTQAAEPGQGVFAARLDHAPASLTSAGPGGGAEAADLDRGPSRPARALRRQRSGQRRQVPGQASTRPRRSATGRLTLVGTVPSGGGGPTHLALDTASKTLLVANYGTGQVAALPVLADATLGPPASVQPTRARAPIASAEGPARPRRGAGSVGPFRPGRRSRGRPRVRLPYDRASRQLEPRGTPVEALPPGTGPRHLAFHPNGRWSS
jgi:6-phosphogluconolactonase